MDAVILSASEAPIESVVLSASAPVESDYVLNIKIPFKAMDDVKARETANSIIDSSTIADGFTLIERYKDGCVVKLQRVYSDKAPAGISLT